MAPPPEYDKEPKAPDKSATNVSCEDMKTVCNLVNDQPTISDNKSASTATNSEVENNKLVETLDDGQLRALLDEAITYKCPKDREGKSNLFKELLEEVEQDEQATEAAARSVNSRNCGTRASRPSRNRRALPHSNSLQDLVAALAAEPAPRRHRPAPAPVSARALHGGSLPSGVDTSFLLGEEPMSGGYLATVRCVNPPPLGERRVSTDSTQGTELELLNRRSKPAFPMTYTARATLEIGAGAVGAGRATTTTTASNQVRTAHSAVPRTPHARGQTPPAHPLKTPRGGKKQRGQRAHKIPKQNIPLTRAGGVHIYHEVPQTQNIQNVPEKQRYYCQNYKYKIEQSGHEIPNVYSYRRAPTYGPPERLHSQKLYNYRGNRRRRNVRTEPEEGLFYKSILEQLEDNDENSPEDQSSTKEESSRIEISNEVEEPVNNEVNRNLDENEPSVFFEDNIDPKQYKLLSALFPKMSCNTEDGGGNKEIAEKTEIIFETVVTNKQNCGPRKDLVKVTEDQSTINVDNPSKTRTKNKKKTKNKKTKNKPKNKTEKTLEGIPPDQPLKNPDAFVEKISKVRNVKIAKAPEDNAKDKHKIDKNWMANMNNWYGTIDSYVGETIFKRCYRRPEPSPFCEALNKKQSQSTSESKNLHQPVNLQPFQSTLQSDSESEQSLPAKDVEDAYERIVKQNLKDRFKFIELYEDRKTLSAKIANHPKVNYQSDEKNKLNTEKYETSSVDYENRPLADYSNSLNLDHYNDYFRLVDYNYDDYDKNIYQSRIKYRERIGRNLADPKVEINPRNFRSMTIGKPIPELDDDVSTSTEILTERPVKDNLNNKPKTAEKENYEESSDRLAGIHQDVIVSSSEVKEILEFKDDEKVADISLNISVRSSTPVNEQIYETDVDQSEHTEEVYHEDTTKESPDQNEDDKGTVKIPIISQSDCVTLSISEVLSSHFCSFSDRDDCCGHTEISSDEKEENQKELKNIYNLPSKKFYENVLDVELKDMSSCHKPKELLHDDQTFVNVPSSCDQEDTSFSKFYASQQNLFQVLECSDLVDSAQEHSLVSLYNSEKVQYADDKLSECICVVQDNIEVSHSIVPCESPSIKEECSEAVTAGLSSEVVIQLDKSTVEKSSEEVFANVLAELPNNAYVFLTLPQHLLSHLNNNDDSVKVQIENNINDKPYAKENKNKAKKKKDVSVECAKKKEISNKKNLRALLFENLFKSNSADKSKSKGMSTTNNKEVDSAIPFSCITTPEVVASCNTTSSTVQSAVAVDPKPRSVVASTFNGLPLSRPNYGSTASTTQDEFKKSLDENGNSVQGYSSPLSGSSQHKKPRRKKSSKNETVITSHQIDGYQGNKDLNEVLRFIESNAENTRAGKLGRAKHKDDSDDKGGKKRSTERRKDKESKMKRATSMEELSRTKLEDLTDKPGKKERRTDTVPKAERRSWGDDARDSFYYECEPAESDFQTVTKKRKPRRRADDGAEGEGGGDQPRAPRPPERPRRVSAPPSDRSNDSNDDMDSVHSLPAPAPQPPSAPTAVSISYADIARTRHNIPDLIESCNFYLEEAGGAEDTYPPLALAPRRAPPPPAPKPALHTPTPARTHRKPERPIEHGAECPAPDVVSDRRPPVILLDSSRPHDMDGVTFGFDINEQLLGGPARRPRCDLVVDAMSGAAGATGAEGAVHLSRDGAEETGADDGVPAARGLRYVPPSAPHDTKHLLQIVHYVGAAWEDVVRCGGGKVRYFSE